MSIFHRSLLDVDSLTPENIELLFHRAHQFSTRGYPEMKFTSTRPLVALLFFEPSTRTRFSFKIAAKRLRFSTVVLDDLASTSMRKGETLADTVLNVEAMGTDALIIRYGEDTELTDLLPKLKTPVISAGQGKISHPTQALLDAFTIRQELGQMKGQKVLIVGDVAHSRVAASNIKLLTRLGAQVGIAGPENLLQLPQSLSTNVEVFDLDDGMRWASVVMALRIQLERFETGLKDAVKPHQYAERYGINPKRLEAFSARGLILHPGPVNQNVELDSAVFADPRCRILQQVSNGVFMRAALLYETLIADRMVLDA